jgi:hypothetical protein
MSEMLIIGPEHERDAYSQSGEDGVIAAICSELGIDRGVAVEFGAWDGVHLSNTALLRESGWETCLIEGDPRRYAALEARFRNDPRVVTVNGWVRTEGEMSLDVLFERTFAKPIDLLSIDIDSDDYQIFASLKARPRIVVIEYNPTIPPMIDRVNPTGTAKGTSLAALARLGGEKGYELVHATSNNAILIDAARNGRIRAKSASEAFDWRQTAFVMSDFDGENWVADGTGKIGVVRNPWSGKPQVRVLGPPPRIRLRRLQRWIRGKLPARGG